MFRTSILDGVPLATLQARLTALQLGYLDLTSGNKGESFTYSQGDGAQSVVYTRAHIGDLTQAILIVQTEIDRQSGMRINRRRPMRPFF